MWPTFISGGNQKIVCLFVCPPPLSWTRSFARTTKWKSSSKCWWERYGTVQMIISWLVNSMGSGRVEKGKVVEKQEGSRGPNGSSPSPPSIAFVLLQPGLLWVRSFFFNQSSFFGHGPEKNKQKNWANPFFWWPFHHGGVVQWEVWKWGLLWKAGKSSRQKAETK